MRFNLLKAALLSDPIGNPFPSDRKAHHRLGFARPAHDLGGPAAISGGKDDLGAPHMLLWCAGMIRRRSPQADGDPPG
jgi:hypothetical protein